MSTLLLRLEGPLQAWSTQGKLRVRDTEREPTKSGVLGLIAAAMGMPREDDNRLATLASLAMGVRVDRPGSLLRDYHTTGGGRFRGFARYSAAGTKDAIRSERFYLQDASFLVGLSGDASVLESAAKALQAPRWPLFLGRRACPPSRPIYCGLGGAELEEALRVEAIPDGVLDESVRGVLDGSPSDRGEPRYDVPLSFRPGDRRYGVRYVRTIWIAIPRPAGPTRA